MLRIARKISESRLFRYLFIGGLTSLVSIGSFYVMNKVLYWEANLANVVSICLAIIFAYFTNKIIVFRSTSFEVTFVCRELYRFISSRLLSMLLEVGGVFFLHQVLKVDELYAKIGITFFVIVFNYLVSHYLVFTEVRPMNKMESGTEE